MTFSDVVDLVVGAAFARTSMEDRDRPRVRGDVVAWHDAAPTIRRAYNDAIERACEAGWSELAVRQRRERRRVVTVVASRGGDA